MAENEDNPMNEELNPTNEDGTTQADSPETTPTPAPDAPVATEIVPAAAAPADIAPVETAQAAPASDTSPTNVAPVAAPPVYSPPPASAPPASAGDNSGPREFAAEHEGGGRGRRTSVDVRLEDVSYKNVPLLSRFIDPRGRILSRRKTRVSAKVQRHVVKAIKLARHLALLPYTADQSRIVRRRR
jgi:small subunit ribosomal protein S18